MRFASSVLLCTFFALYNAIQPLRPPVKRSFPRANATQVGEPLFLTPYIESGDIATAQSMALVDWTLLQGKMIKCLLNHCLIHYSRTK